MKNGKTAEQSGVQSEMGKPVGEAEVEMITNLVNQNIVEEFIPAE